MTATILPHAHLFPATVVVTPGVIRVAIPAVPALVAAVGTASIPEILPALQVAEAVLAATGS